MIMGVKIYSLSKDGEKQLSPHFKVREFASVNSYGRVWSDVVKVDDRLVELLEKLYSTLGCGNDGYIRINSGYRTPSHDKYVGGSGSGKHVDGMAADIVCCANGNIVSSKIVCCIAAELGFGGVANITGSYTATHVDTRTSNKYYGDEVRGYSSIWYYNSAWTDFYTYFGLSRADVNKYRASSDNSTDQNQSTDDTTDTGKGKIESTDEHGPYPKSVWLYKRDPQITNLQSILQSKGNGIECDGIAGPATYAACMNYTIENGDRGPLSAWVQKRLNQLGYTCISDGIVGPKTMAAIAKFQKDNGLGIGELGGSDWYYLISPVVKK